MTDSHAINETDFLEMFGDEDLNEIIPKVYTELKRLAAYHLQNERPNHTLRPTELVHEVYLLRHKSICLILMTGFIRIKRFQCFYVGTFLRNRCSALGMG